LSSGEIESQSHDQPNPAVKPPSDTHSQAPKYNGSSSQSPTPSIATPGQITVADADRKPIHLNPDR